MNKENILELSKGYVKHCKRNLNIDNALRRFNIYVDNEEEPLVSSTEKILSDCISSDYLDALCDLAFEDKAIFYINNQETEITTVEDILNIYTN